MVDRSWEIFHKNPIYCGFFLIFFCTWGMSLIFNLLRRSAKGEPHFWLAPEQCIFWGLGTPMTAAPPPPVDKSGARIQKPSHDSVVGQR